MTTANVFYPALVGIRGISGALSGGKAYFYEPGTTTPRAIYLDAAMQIPAANPYILDSNGQAQLFTSGVYDIIVNNAADALVYSWESYNGIDINAIIDNTAIADILAGTAGFEAGNALKLGGQTKAQILATEAWIHPTLLNSWVNFGGTEQDLSYAKDACGFVHVQGAIKSGISDVVCQFIAGYRPLKTINAHATADTTIKTATVAADGTFTVVGSSTAFTAVNFIYKAEA